MDGHFRIDCHACPSPSYGKDCTSMCNWIADEQCHYILECTKSQGTCRVWETYWETIAFTTIYEMQQLIFMTIMHCWTVFVTALNVLWNDWA